MDKRYEVYALADEHSYDTPDRLSAAGPAPLYEAARREAPEGGEAARTGDWPALTPLGTDGRPAPAPAQGWKVHSSATWANTERIAALVWDHCVPRRIPFRSVTLPAFLQPHLDARNTTTVGELPCRIDRAPHFSDGGGVYTGTGTRDGRRVVLRVVPKEARPHAGPAADGADAVARLERERQALEQGHPENLGFEPGCAPLQSVLRAGRDRSAPLTAPCARCAGGRRARTVYMFRRHSPICGPRGGEGWA